MMSKPTANPNADPNATPNATPLTYETAGVNYDLIDPLKIHAQQAAAQTGRQLQRHGMQEVTASRGESAYVVDAGPFYIASIVECLGSKAMVADTMATLTGRSFYDAIAQDTIAMAINDLITVGATPLVVQAYWAAGGSEWFKDAARSKALVDGWQRACEACGVAWGGGETPALAGIVEAGRIDLAAGCTGIVRPKSRLTLGDQLQAGDAVVLLASSGIHANGLSLARALADRLPQGYLTPMPMPSAAGKANPSVTLTYGDALLAPTLLYAPVTEALAAAGITPRYAANITGHGWRKLMRHSSPFTYRFHTLPPVPAVLRFIQHETSMSDADAYGTLNMGAGFALYLAAADAPKAVAVAQACGIDAWVAGHVEAGPKQVVIEPLNVTFGSDSMHLRA
jgi:phosphoribosylformylglycinamidine cyclo-ligase